MKQKYQIIASATVIFVILMSAFAFGFIGSIHAVNAATGCDINDFSQANASYTVSFQPTAIKATTNFTAKVTVIFKDASTEVRCKNQGFVFEFVYESTGDSVVKAPVSVMAEQALINGKWGYLAIDNQSWSGLTQKTKLDSSAVLKVSLNVIAFGLSIDNAGNNQVTVQPDAVAPGTKPPASGTTPPATTPTAPASGDCKQFGADYKTIPGTSFCVPPGPGGGNGIAGSDSIFKVIATVIRILLILAGALAVLFIIIGGFWYLTSAGNEEQATKGKKALMYAILGLVIIVLSYSIVAILIRTLTSSPEEIISGGGSSSSTSGGTPSPGGTPDPSIPPGPPPSGTPNP